MVKVVHDLDAEREERAEQYLAEVHAWVDSEAEGWDHVLLICVTGNDVCISAPEDLSTLEILGALEMVKTKLVLDEEDV